MGKFKKEDIEELEKFLVEEYDPEVINTLPKTEKELLEAYQLYADVLYQYVRSTVNHFMHAINNEIRALLGHLAEYRVSKTSPGKRDLDKAYGHFRRMNLDALKILCDEFDRTLSKILKKQCKYDYRDVRINYLHDFGEKYIVAKNLYIKAQQEEKVGCDSHSHNVIALYYNAAREYILLKRYYQEHKKETKRIERKSIVRVVAITAFTLFGITVSVIDLFL